MNKTARFDIKQMILYEDGDILVCRKAAGIPVQSAGVGTKDLESILLNYLSQQKEQENKKEQQGKGNFSSQGIPYLGIVHRLDQPVEGIVVFAKNKKAAADLSRQISEGTMKKVYNAVCCVDKAAGFGDKRPEQKKGSEEGAERKEEEVCLTDWIKKDARSNSSSLVPAGTPGAKKAELEYRILQRKTVLGKEYVLVRIRLLTGRHHQIRVQMAGAGFALYGDRKYNAGWRECLLEESEEERETKLKLCASELTFRHPVSKKQMSFKIRPSFWDLLYKSGLRTEERSADFCS